jgi:hypothetical protein
MYGIYMFTFARLLFCLRKFESESAPVSGIDGDDLPVEAYDGHVRGRIE